jgi:hypothetical protein
MVAGPVLVLFCGGLGGSPVEDQMAEALRASALDSLDEALSSGAFESAILVADRATAEVLRPQVPAGVSTDVDRPGEGFHFGRRLADVIGRYQLERPVYMGCGLPLIKADELAGVARALQVGERVVVANNYFSADLVAFAPGGVVSELDLPDNDRILPRLLAEGAGLDNQALPRTIANQFDLDTPVDLAVLACAGGAGPRLQRWLDQAGLETERLGEAGWLFTDRDAEVLVAGRVPNQVMQYLTTEAACRTRIFSEERGMQAAARDTSGEARSLLAYHLEAVEPRRFFAELSEMAHAAFIDTRVIIAHLGLNPSRADRFLSDALQPDSIDDPWLRQFTAAAQHASIPVVLGGSSLVAAGIPLLAEAAWRRHDQLKAEYQARGRAAR